MKNYRVDRFEPGVFYIDFPNSSRSIYNIYGFIITKTGVEKLMKYKNNKKYINFELYAADLERLETKYGRGAGWNSGGEGVEVVGAYICTETKFRKRYKLLEEWRAVFVGLCGDTEVSDVVKLDKIKDTNSNGDIFVLDDQEIFDMIKINAEKKKLERSIKNIGTPTNDKKNKI